MMEGIASEAASLAGRLHLGLGKLTVFFDANHITLEGAADVEFAENVAERFEAYGWHVAEVSNANALAEIDRAIAAASAEAERPSLIVVHSHIGFGSPVQDSAKAHGEPLGEDNVAATRKALNWSHPPFEIPEAVYATGGPGRRARGAPGPPGSSGSRATAPRSRSTQPSSSG